MEVMGSAMEYNLEQLQKVHNYKHVHVNLIMSSSDGSM